MTSHVLAHRGASGLCKYIVRRTCSIWKLPWDNSCVNKIYLPRLPPPLAVTFFILSPAFCQTQVFLIMFQFEIHMNLSFSFPGSCERFTFLIHPDVFTRFPTPPISFHCFHVVHSFPSICSAAGFLSHSNKAALCFIFSCVFIHIFPHNVSSWNCLLPWVPHSESLMFCSLLLFTISLLFLLQLCSGHAVGLDAGSYASFSLGNTDNISVLESWNI